MKILGIITEYNPFHNGHQLHLKQAQKKTKADATICIMSGCFLQRGRPAVVNHWARTRMALQAGVDLIIQLPVVYSTRSAEYFAHGAVQLLAATNIVDCLCFGSETGTIKPLKYIGQLLAEEPEELSKLIKSELNQGISYPQARANAVLNYSRRKNLQLDTDQIKTALTKANNILGLEYIKALTRLNSSIEPITIQRVGSEYHDSNLSEIASGTALRRQIKKNQVNKQPLLDSAIKAAVPNFSYQILSEEFNSGRGPIFPTDFEQQILTLLRRSKTDQLQNYEGIVGGLENRIKRSANQASSLTKLIDLINTKRFAQTRIQRLLIHLLLDLTQAELTDFADRGGPQYFKILGFNQRGRKLLKSIKNKGSLPLITNLGNHFQSSYQPRNEKQKMLSYDILASNLYALAYSNSEFKTGGADFKIPPIVVDGDN